MAELEKIYGTDAGTVAIKKLDRNIKAINLGMENIDISKQIGTHNTDEEAHPKLAKQIGVLPTLKTTNKENLVGAINESVDEITALQGKCIYLNGAINLDNVIKKGTYFINSTTELVTGTGIVNAYVNVYVSNVTGHLVQKIIRHNQDDGFYIAYRQQVGTWQRWTPIATTDKTSFMPTALPGYTIIANSSSIQNGFAFINITVKRLDEGVMGDGIVSLKLATLPFKPKVITALSTISYMGIVVGTNLNGGTSYVLESKELIAGLPSGSKSCTVSGIVEVD